MLIQLNEVLAKVHMSLLHTVVVGRRDYIFVRLTYEVQKVLLAHEEGDTPDSGRSCMHAREKYSLLNLWPLMMTLIILWPVYVPVEIPQLG